MSSGYTTVIYGNVKFFRCTTRVVEQKPQFDPSGTDLLYMRTKVEISGFLNGHSIAESAYQLTSDGTTIEQTELGYASVRESQIRRQLGPRQTFTMKVGDSVGDGSGGQILIYCKPAPATMVPPPNPGNTRVSPNQPGVVLSDIDLNNGPRCLDFSITQLTGNETYSISAVFEICQLECDLFGNVPNNKFGILSNRWSCIDTLDHNLQTTRTYAGHLVLASANLNAQQLRWIVLPPIVQMMRRDKMEIQISTDGLTMNWSVTDVEIAQSAPYPARKWQVTHTVGGAIAFMGRNTISVELEGDSNVNKGDLIDLAMYIITAKLFGVVPPNLLGGGLPDAFWRQQTVESLQVVDMIGDVNKIMATATCLSTPLSVDNKLMIPKFTQNFGKPLTDADVRIPSAAIATPPRQPYDRSYSWGGYANDTPPYASPAATITQIFLSYLQNPCTDTHASYFRGGTGGPVNGNLDTNDLNFGSNPPFPPPNVPYSAQIQDSIDPLPTPNSLLSTSQTNASYTHWTIDNLYRTTAMRVAMPIAAGVIALPTDRNALDVYAPAVNFAPATSVCQLAPPQTTRTLRVSAERLGQEPEFPDPDTFLSQFPMNPSTTVGYNSYEWPGIDPRIYQYVLDHTIRPGTPTTTISGQKIYRADAEYIFALSRKPNPKEQLALGTDMWSTINNIIAGTSVRTLFSDAGSYLTNSDWKTPVPPPSPGP